MNLSRWKFWEWGIIKNNIEKKTKYPCASDNCLVRAACTIACDKLIMDTGELKEAFEKDECCPDCGSEKFKEGPHGGGAVNVQCAGCGHYFNWALPLFIERIHISASGRFCR